jgi:steroid delta-isomerase-like uncharacterized protein
MFDGLLGV